MSFNIYIMSKKLTHKEILDRLEKLNPGKYEYVIGDIKGVHDKIKLICKEHGESFPILNDLFGGTICKRCAIENGKKLQRRGFEDFVKISIDKFGLDSFDYSKVDYINNRTKVILTCKKHNISFSQVPHQHLMGNISCPKCSKVISIGENVIREILIKSGIKYIEQHSFKDCKNRHILKLDFYLPDYNTIVEYDGKQHFIQGWNSFKEFERTKQNDVIKNKYCIDNNIKMLRISYLDFKNILDILKKELSI